MSPSFPDSATLVEVGLRDGLQAEAVTVPTALKVELVDGLVAAGLADIQIASFVHPGRVPQMADAEAVCAAVRARHPRGGGAVFSGLALNARGVERAAEADLDAVDLSISTNDAHSVRNAGMDVRAAQRDLARMVATSREAGLEVRAGLQCVWGAGDDGPTSPDRVLKMVRETLMLGVDQLSLADSTGQATPLSVARMLERIRPLADAAGVPVVLHLHDTWGAGLANVTEALRQGVTHFDVALGGTGGCPFIPGATGNIPTEDTARLLDGLGVATGVDATAVARLSRRLEAVLGHGFSGKAWALLAEPAG